MNVRIKDARVIRTKVAVSFGSFSVTDIRRSCHSFGTEDGRDRAERFDLVRDGIQQSRIFCGMGRTKMSWENASFRLYILHIQMLYSALL
jgi:hypothetical protein